MKDYWSILDFRNDELLAIMECDVSMPEKEEACFVCDQLGTKRQGWCWGESISKAEFETFQAFGIKEIKL